MATAADHLAAQSAIVSAQAEQMVTLWPLVDVQNLAETLPRWRLAVGAVVDKWSKASSALAAVYYDHARETAGVPGKFSVSPAPTAPFEQISKGLDWSTKGLWSETPDVETSQQLATSTAERYTLNAGRQTIITAANADRKSHGWARIVEPGSCSFCLLLATRGAVYRTEQSSDFEAHDHCRCHAQPVFDAVYEPSARVRRAQQLYKQAKATSRGTNATLRTFRQLVEAEESPSAATA